MEKIHVGIIGSSGFVGGELLRFLLAHPNVKVDHVTSESNANTPVSKILPVLRNNPQAKKIKFQKLEELGEVDLVFTCLPQGVLPQKAEWILKRCKRILNLAGDYRLFDKELIKKHYPKTLENPLTYPTQYVVPEFSESFLEEGIINLPGCMAVATLYALYPLVKENLIKDHLVVDIKTGSSGGGKTSREHVAERAHNFRPHKLQGHRHQPEVEEALEKFANHKISLQFSTYSLDFPRGIFVSAYTKLKSGVSNIDVRKTFFSAYKQLRFINYQNGSGGKFHYPMIKTVIGSNFVEVGTSVSGDNCVIVSSLDNLIKGAAGQAVQTMNLLFGLDEELGLPNGGGWP